MFQGLCFVCSGFRVIGGFVKISIHFYLYFTFTSAPIAKDTVLFFVRVRM